MSEPKFHPNPASVLAKLIYHGVATVPPEQLSSDWRIGYEAARSVHGTGHVGRRAAFETAVADDPACHIMDAEIEDAYHYLENPPEDQLRVYSAWETVHDPPPQLEFVVDGMIARSSVNLIVGAPGAMKTWAAIDLAVAVASGQPWFGHSTRPNARAQHAAPADNEGGVSPPLPMEKLVPSEPPIGSDEKSQIENLKSKIINSFDVPPHGSPVLFIDAEGGAQRTWDRINRTMKGHNADPQIPLYFIPPVFYNLTDDREEQSIAARARSLGAKLIIIDALANVIGLTDENNPALIQPILKRLHKLAEDTGAAVVVVHHTNKQGVFRGSSFIASSVDHMLLVESEPDEPVLKIRTFKARDIEPISIDAYADFQPGSFKLVKIDQRQSEPRAALSKPCREVLQYLVDNPQTTTPHIIRRLNSISPSAARKVIYELMVAGFLCRTDPGSRGRIASYEISEKGLDFISREGGGAPRNNIFLTHTNLNNQIHAPPPA